MEPVANDTSFQQSGSEPSTPPEPHDHRGDFMLGESIRTIISLPSDLEDVERNGPTNSLERTTTPNNSPIKHMSQRDSSWLEIEVCREFLRGECIRSAEECRYAHPTSSVVTKDGNKVTCCFDFLKVCNKSSSLHCTGRSVQSN